MKLVLKTLFSRYGYPVVVEAVLAAVLMFVAQRVLETRMSAGWDVAWTLGFAALTGAVLSWVATGSARRVQRCLTRNSETLAGTSALAPKGERLPLPVRLQEIVEAARDLTGAQSSVLELTELGIVVTATPDTDNAEREGMRLLAVLTEKYRLHLEELSELSISISAPIRSAGQTVGHLTVRRKSKVLPFGPEDQALLNWCAMRIALCLENEQRSGRLKEQAIAEERARMAREMHDSLAQVLSYINAKGQVVQELLRRGRADQATAHLEQLVKAAQTACGDIREEIVALRSTPQAEGNMIETLCEYLRQWEQFTGVKTHLEVDTGQNVLPLAPEARLQLLRIIQAALSNVRKHAAATGVEIAIRPDPGWLETVIEDNGVGFDAVAQRETAMPRFGLAMMRERAEAVGGELKVGSAPGTGTQVTVRLPVAERIERRRVQTCGC